MALFAFSIPPLLLELEPFRVNFVLQRCHPNNLSDQMAAPMYTSFRSVSVTPVHDTSSKDLSYKREVCFMQMRGVCHTNRRYMKFVQGIPTTEEHTFGKGQNANHKLTSILSYFLEVSRTWVARTPLNYRAVIA